MEIKDLHNWNLSPKKAIQLQNSLAEKLTFSPISKKIKNIAALDCSLIKEKNIIIAGTVVLSYPDMQLIEKTHAVAKLDFPYVPGLLSFREGPVCIKALKKLKTTPDVLLIDGQGIAHPRGLGLASHLGLFVDIPTIGCAKSRLIGEYKPVKAKKGNYSDLVYKDKIIGAVLRTRDNVKPLFVSPGNRCTIADCISIVLNSTTKYRLPEPARLAHQTVTNLKKSKISAR